MVGDIPTGRLRGFNVLACENGEEPVRDDVMLEGLHDGRTRRFGRATADRVDKEQRRSLLLGKRLLDRTRTVKLDKSDAGEIVSHGLHKGRIVLRSELTGSIGHGLSRVSGVKAVVGSRCSSS